MSVQNILYTDKETFQVSELDEVNKATAANYNEIKAVVNFNADTLDNIVAGTWVPDLTTGDVSAIQNTVTSDITAQTGTKTFNGLDWTIDVTGRTSTGEVNFLDFKKTDTGTTSVFKVDINGKVTIQNGSGVNTDLNIDSKNNAGTTKFSVDGNGDIVASQITVGEGSTNGIFLRGITESINAVGSTIQFKVNFASRFQMTTTGILGIVSGSAGLLNEASSSTNPTLIPRALNLNIGIGGDANELDLIVNSISGLNINTNQITTTLSQLKTTASTTLAAINIGSFAGDPSALVNGDKWYNSSTEKFRARENGVSVDEIGGDEVVLTASLVLTQSQIQALNTTPIEIIAAPAGGTFVKIISGTSRYLHDTSDFSGGSIVQLRSGGVNWQSVTGFISNSTDALFALIENETTISIASSIEVGADADSTGGGASSIIQIDVQYVITDLN